MPASLPGLAFQHHIADTDCLSAQVELLQQAAVNRPRLYSVLEKAAADVPDRQAQAGKRMRSEEYVRAYMLVCSLQPCHPNLTLRLILLCKGGFGVIPSISHLSLHGSGLPGARSAVTTP